MVFTLPQYTYMSLICNLPNDLFHSVLLMWLRHVDVGKLDSAMCNTEQRQQFQSAVTHSGFVLSNRYRSAVRTGVQNRLDSFLQWFMKRGIPTSQLTVTDSFVIEGGERLKYLRQYGKRVSEVIICNIMAHFNEIKAAIEDVCVHCPDILSFKNFKHTRQLGYHEHACLISVIAFGCPQLRNLYTCTGLADSDLIALGERCPHLTTVERICVWVTDDGLLAIARSGALLSLGLDSCLQLTDVGLQAAVGFCRRLESVYLDSCEQLTDATLIALGQYCHNLRDLNISCTDTTEKGLRAIAAGCPLLEELIAEQCAVGSAVEHIARSCPHLRVLIVPNVVVPREAALALAECCPLLQELDIYSCKAIGDEEITALVCGCPALWMLNIRGTSVTGMGRCAIRDGCRNLWRLIW
jgi:hypothetical protein